jgi:hypothetical protein
MDKLKDIKVNADLSGKQLKEICLTIGIKYYLLKPKCVERIKKRLEVLKKEEETSEPNEGEKRVTSSSPPQYNKRKKGSKKEKANIRASDKRTTRRSCTKVIIDDDEDNDTDKDDQIVEEVTEAHDGRVEEEDEDVDDEIRDLTWVLPRRNDGLDDIDIEEEVVNYSDIETDDGESVSTNSSSRRQPVY